MRLLNADMRFCRYAEWMTCLSPQWVVPVLILSVFAPSAGLHAVEPVRPAPQAEIRWLQNMPAAPRDLAIPDWREIAAGFDRVVFDYDRTGKHFPVIWKDLTDRNYPQETFGLPSYFGDTRQAKGRQEGFVVIGSVLGSELAGLDKRLENGRDFVAMTLNHHNKENGRNVVLNGVDTENSSFWYDLYPAILFFGLADRYPEDEQLTEVVRQQADQVVRAVEVLDGNYQVTAFDFLTYEPVINGRWIEPDGSAGLAWLAYAGYQRFGDRRYLEATRRAYQAFEVETGNPTYEVLGPFGALVAARLAAEHGDDVDIHKILSWAFEPDSSARKGWGMIFGEWGGYPVDGLYGSAADGGGFAFAMNTFNHAIPLVPLPRYDPRYAREIGRWMLHAANNAWIFYPGALPAGLQTGHELIDSTEGFIPYEAVRRDWGGTSPKAMGDPLVHGWAPTDLGIYSGMLAGVFAAVVGRTSDPAILEIDTLVTDFFRKEAYPTFLYYNPFPEDRRFSIDVGSEPMNLYDSVSKRILARGARGETELQLPPGGAAVIARVPVEHVLERQGKRLVANGFVVDYDLSPEPILSDLKTEGACLVFAPRTTMRGNGDGIDWQERVDSGNAVTLSTPEGTEVNFHFAWDDDYLYAWVREVKAGVSTQEAQDAEAYRGSPWEYDGVSLYFDLANDNHGQRYWEVAIRAGFSSEPLEGAIRDQVYRQGPGIPRGIRQTRSISRSQDGERVIEMAIAWQDLERLVPLDRRGHWSGGAPPAEYRFGCEPSVLLNNWRAEYWLSGRRAPAGDDKFSIDIELK